MRAPPPEDTDDDSAYSFERPSKTQLKTQSHELQTLGLELAALPDNRLAAIEMPEALRDAILQYRRTKSHEGRRRQMQYVGKQMRLVDADPLREAVAAYKLGSAKDTLMLHEAERWRDELIVDEDASTRWAKAYPQSDLQRLRSLVRAARKDAAAAPEQRNGRGYRELFQFVKPWLANSDEGGSNDE
ncbi:ribosome biogenesis factor YjgA [Aquabacterium sp.]|uniref:ribosome biogenesis factor YjgA n=1 Tax=Aquabacterium sp. TaxID=1872578 RepID=UPI002CD16C2E|nr:ribosome biogenesis factor YjgA [Aquabacterium sp.]HSW06721.1 ribosome biogenesis factor YjgA [Aquabacterium sp.]